MPHDFAFPVSFPIRRNPYENQAYRREREWCVRYGLSEHDTSRVLDGHPGRFAAYANPTARNQELALATDQTCFFFYIDNRFDTELFDNPAVAVGLITCLIAILNGPPPRTRDPAVAMFTDLWRTECEGMSQTWRRRAETHWETYFWGNLVEATARCRSSVPDAVDDYLSMRRDTIGVQPPIDLSERLGRFEVPGEMYCQPEFRQLRTLAADLVVLGNDVASLEKEEERGDQFNAITLLRKRDGLNRAAALEKIAALIERKATEFHTLQAQMPALCDTLQLNGLRREGALRGAEAAYQAVSGTFAWQPGTPRYVSGEQLSGATEN